MKLKFVLSGLLLLGMTGLAELKLPALFSDGMVLQRDQQVAVWGWADPGADVVVSFAGQQKSVKANPDGTFLVRLDTMKASADPRPLAVRAGTDAVEVKNVLVGEVWLCSGQSNMQMAVAAADNFKAEQAAANHPLIRMFTTVRNASPEPLADCRGSWSVCTPESVGGFSAAGYFFGREIQQALGVPVGLIHSSWGGTCIEAWSPLESLAPYPLAMKTKAGYDAGARKFSAAAEEERFAKVHAQWQEKAKTATANGKAAPREPQRRVNPRLNQNYPANLYNAMIHPLVPYGMRGAIWYQGERNAKSYAGAMEYRALLENLVTRWRADWNDEFPFYAVQLVNYKAPQTKPVENSAWACIRDSFLNFHKEVPHAGIAVAIDVGMEKNIHPTNKQAVGFRLARQALAKTYGLDVVPGGPIYRSMKKDGDKIVVAFDDVGAGLVAQGGAPLKRFAIAGADRNFVEAKAVIAGDTVVVGSDQVADPVAVRYAWADNPVGCNLFNKDGFPASPFRTDDWAPGAE
ncbi:sialate O-acetylesterase [Pontiella sp.]|uniref:sialate O-acetylesterase n=1 Tax=Pontiella sp. TaxID=2837462 RepID=UPI00356810D9